MSCTADPATLPAAAGAVDAAPEATIEVSLGVMHVLTLLSLPLLSVPCGVINHVLA